MEKSYVFNILVTGGAGFIGSHLSQYLTKKYENYKIVVLDKLDYCSNLKNISSLKSKNNFKFYYGNILDTDLLKRIFEEEKIDIVMHLAASTHVDNSFVNSILFTENNVLGTHKLLEVSRLYSIKKFIFASTDEVYGCGVGSDFKDSIVEDNSVLKPTNPYSASKSAAEILVQTYHRSFSLPVIITRGNNVYGECQYPDKVIPKFITRLSKGLPCTIQGTGNNRRSYLYVEDVVDAFDLILHKGVIAEIYNIGTDFEISNLNLAESLLNLFGYENKDNEYIQFIQDRLFNDFRYNINCNKLKELGWSPKIPFELGIRKTFNWYLKNLDYWEDNSDSINLNDKIIENQSSIMKSNNNKIIVL